MMMAMGGAANLNWVQVASSDYSLHSNRPNVDDDGDSDGDSDDAPKIADAEDTDVDGSDCHFNLN